MTCTRRGGGGVSSSEVIRHATATYSHLVREGEVRGSPVADVKVAVVAAEVSRPVREEAGESEVGDSQSSVVPSQDPEEVKKQGSTPCGRLWNDPHLRGGKTSGTACVRCLAVVSGHGS